jgi:hypothetical protein
MRQPTPVYSSEKNTIRANTVTQCRNAIYSKPKADNTNPTGRCEYPRIKPVLKLHSWIKTTGNEYRTRMRLHV